MHPHLHHDASVKVTKCHENIVFFFILVIFCEIFWLSTNEEAMKTERDKRRNQGPNTVGTDIRALRKSRKMTISELADGLGRSLGFISQIERGLSMPSISDLRAIAAIFDVPVSFFFGEKSNTPAEAKHVVRAGERRQIGTAITGLLEELLSPDLSGSFETIRCEFLPESKIDDHLQRDTEEAGYVVSGVFEIEIEDTWHTLKEGDSFKLTGEAYRWRNRGKKSAIVIWVISPPVY